MVRCVVSISVQMVTLKVKLILRAKCCLFVLVQSCQGKITSRNTSTIRSIMDPWHVHRVGLRGCLPIPIDIDVLHEVCSWELKWISISVCDSHWDKLIFLDLNIKYLLFRNAICRYCFSCRWKISVNLNCLHCSNWGWLYVKGVDRRVSWNIDR